MKVGILGAGLSGISLAYMLQEDARVEGIELLEKDARPGGLCCSHPFAGVHADVGPHILFSKNAAVLELLVSMLGDNIHKLRRSSKIFHDSRFVKYPFENELSALSPAERDYCLNSFLNNPYERYAPQNMLQFFLKTFGEGITNLYLRPYNEKIWKFDPAFMDLQMVERIPKPPPEDIIKSAQGIPTEGYTHQLFFYYPKRGGIQSLVDSFLTKLGGKVSIRTGVEVRRVSRAGGKWMVESSDGNVRHYDRLVSTIPIPDLLSLLEPRAPEEVLQAADNLKFNSIAICLFHFTRDNLGENLSFTLPDTRVLFHRVSKLDFLLPPESRDGESRVMAEVTYRAGDRISKMSDAEMLDRVTADLARIKLIDGPDVIRARDITRHRHAYVIYDLDHRRNMKTIREYCEGRFGLMLHGRFGEFEYINMDAVVEKSMKRAKEILNSIAS